MKSYSHLGEDVYCFQNFMNIPRRDAVLFEVGAYDGEAYSNTLALEQFSGCKCVLIEPSPVNVRRIYVNRPNASIHSLAIMANFGVCEFVGDAPVSGIQSELTEHYINAWNLSTSRKYNVLSAPLSVVIEIEKVEYIDFLSIDVQGAEFFVLCSMNWKVPVGVICIELEGQHPEYDEACRGILKGLGFQFKCRLLISEFWYKPDYYRSSLLFDPSQKLYPLETFQHLYWDGKYQAELRSNFYQLWSHNKSDTQLDIPDYHLNRSKTANQVLNIEYSIEVRTSFNGELPLVSGPRSEWHNGTIIAVVSKQ